MVSAFIGGKYMQYKYRPDGLRLSKSDGVSTTTHIWDGQNMAMELDGTGAMTAKYVRGINLLESEDKTGTRKTYMHNAHGDVVQLTSTAGQVLWKYDYDAFGVERPIAGQDPEQDKNTWRYCGEYYDSETGTVYLRARNYEPMTGRFLTEDSFRGTVIDPLSLNLYTYAHNNPVMFFDPSGHAVTSWDKEHLSATDLGRLGEITIAWNYATSDKDKAALHKQAEEIRNKYRASYQIGDGKGNTINTLPDHKETYSVYYTDTNGKQYYSIESATAAIRQDELLNNIHSNISSASKGGFQAPKVYVNNKGQITNGTYKINSKAMKPHLDGKLLGESQFFI